jgi:hypothetical protein
MRDAITGYASVFAQDVILTDAAKVPLEGGDLLGAPFKILFARCLFLPLRFSFRSSVFVSARIAGSIASTRSAHSHEERCEKMFRA